MKIFNDQLETPIGMLDITASDTAISSIYFNEQLMQSPCPNQVTDIAKGQLLEYFDGERKIFDLPLEPEGTAFQQQVWQALTTVSFGKTCSYSDIAEIINKPKAVRAVGAANGKNPMTIVVPCHRVIGRNGTLTGYAFGIERKAWLLKHEAAMI